MEILAQTIELLEATTNVKAFLLGVVVGFFLNPELFKTLYVFLKNQKRGKELQRRLNAKAQENKELQEKLHNTQKEIQSLKETSAQEILKLRQSHLRAVKILEEKQTQEIQALKESHTKALKTLQETHSQEIQTLKDEKLKLRLKLRNPKPRWNL